MIEKHFEKANFASVIFDPIPSYSGYWLLTTENLRANVKFENGTNLWDAFYKKTYQDPLEKIFKTPSILEFKTELINLPNENNIGRCLQYNKVEFFAGLVVFLNQNIDRYGLTEEQNIERINLLISYINGSNENLNIAYSDALKVKMKKLKDIIEKEFNSEYFELAMLDYAPFKSVISFTDYIKNLYEKTSLYQIGILRMGDFFDKKVDYNELYNLFNSDTFYLLFAKIILDNNLNADNDKLQNNWRYLSYYKNALEKVFSEDVNYSSEITYYQDGVEIRYSCLDFLNELEFLVRKHPDLLNVKLSIIEESEKEKYKDISLMDKISALKDEDVNLNWIKLDDDENIKKGNNNLTNMRIDILEHSGYVGKPFKGINTFMGYFAFIYPNGLVILEKFWDDIECLNSALNNPTYIINIDDFILLSKQSGISIDEYMKQLENVKRVFHTSINSWQRNLYNDINGKYLLEDALSFIDSIQSDEVKNDK